MTQLRSLGFTPAEEGQSQAITVLRTLGPILAKRWQCDGTIKGYDLAKHFRVMRRLVSSVRDLEVLLRSLQDQPQVCIVRGRLKPDLDPREPITRDLEHFEDAPSHLFLVDVDGFQGTLEGFVATLPEPFQSASYVWQLSGSMGHPSKAGQLRAHLWFWLHKPLRCAEAEAWTAKWLPGADKTVHRVVQVNYTSRPVMAEGQVDPHHERLGFVEGLLDLLVLPASMPVPDVSEERRVTRAQRAKLTDPREKGGIVGAVCRAFEPAQIVDLFPDQFAAGRGTDRITWLGGGGAADGVCVTDSGTHLYNSHATAPTSRAQNLFDFVRWHIFGHLDQAVDPEVLDLDVTAAPSYAATEAWARSLPEVQAQFTGPRAVAAREAIAEPNAEVALQDAAERQQRLIDLRDLIDRTPTIDQLEYEIASRVRKHDFSQGEREQIVHYLRARTKTLLGGAHGLSVKTLRGWIEPLVPLEATFPDLNYDGTPRCTIDNVRVLSGRLGLTFRYNVINKSDELMAPGWSFSPDNYVNASLSQLQSECAKVGIPYSASTLKGYVTNLADQNPYNPVAEMIGGRPWDGRSRLPDFYSTIGFQPHVDLAQAQLMLRRWLIQCVAGALSTEPVQLRGVLTLQGEQNIGKSRWLEALVPAGYRSLVSIGRSIDPHSKDSISTAISHWIVELGELDATFRKADVASMKAFITAPLDRFRRPYAMADSTYQRRTSFCATVNPERFLADETGASRFWCLAVTWLKPDHGIDMQQLWAEIRDYWQAGEQHWMEQHEMQQVLAVSEEHQIECPIYERLAGGFAWESATADPLSVEWKRMTATQALDRVGVSARGNSDLVKAASALKKLGATRVNREGGTGARGWAVPVTVEGKFAEFDL